MLEDAPALLFRFRTEVAVSDRSEIERDGVRDGAPLRPVGADLDARLAGERGLVGRHKLGRTRQARQGNRFGGAWPAEVMTRLAVAVMKGVDVF